MSNYKGIIHYSLFFVHYPAVINLVYPELQLVWWLYGMMVLDFVIDYVKGRTIKLKFTFEKMKATFLKTVQYTSFLMLLWCLINVMKQDASRVILVMNGAYSLLIVIESKSIGENIRDMSPDSNFSRVVLGPFLSLLDTFIKKKTDDNSKIDKTNTAVNEKPAV